MKAHYFSNYFFILKTDNQNTDPVYYLTEKLEFPPAALANPEGIVAIGGDLSPERLLLAYQNGIFPWFNDDSFLMWWSPDPRMVLYPNDIKISKSMAKVLRENRFTLTKNQCFQTVLEQCATVPRRGQDGTWITQNMQAAYLELHKMGHAVSYEVWKDKQLVGGLYGIDLGHIFCGESMFSLVSNASKFAFIQLAQEVQRLNYTMIDCQMYTDHLASLGAKEIPRREFLKLLKRND